MAICITGMHRSGTSLAASWLESCGLTIHDGDVWGPSISNPKGHFEDKDFVRLHAAAIKQVHVNSEGWKIFEGDSLMFNDSHFSSARQLAARRNMKNGAWGWKDPRTVLFLKQWRKIIPALKVLFVWRPCIDVSQSLIIRSRKSKSPHLKISLVESVKLWLYYNMRVCSYKEQHADSTLLLPLNAIVKNDKKVLSLLNDKFQMNLSYNPLSGVLDPSLLHNRPASLRERWVCSYYKSFRLEDRMRSLSDM